MDATVARVVAVLVLVLGLALGSTVLKRGGFTRDGAVQTRMIGRWRIATAVAGTPQARELDLRPDGTYAREDDAGRWSIENGVLVLNDGRRDLHLSVKPHEHHDGEVDVVDIGGEPFTLLAEPKK